MEPQENLRMLIPRKLILNDGSEWNGTAVQGSDKRLLFLTVEEGPSMPEVFAAFSNPEKTKKIVAEVKSIFNPNIQSKTEYEGYTKMTDFKVLTDSFTVQLEKE